MQTIHAGATHCFATTANGKIFTWGMNDNDQCGVAKKGLVKLTPVPVNYRIQQIECGAEHSMFLTSDGRLFGCGSNDKGQLLGRK